MRNVMVVKFDTPERAFSVIPSALLPSLFLIVRHLATFNLLIRRTKQCEPDGFRPARS
jgi:hypothetical protein